VKKKLLIVSILTICVISIFIVYSINKKNIINKSEKFSTNITSNEKIENIDQVIKDEIEIPKTNAEEKTIVENESVENSTSQTPTIPSDETHIEENKITSSVIENSTTPVVENKEQVDDKEKISSTIEDEIIIEEVIDNELENLKKQVEFTTYDKCMKIGFDTALQDTINILGFSCPYIVYQDQILGYRLQLDYTNPMEN